MRAPTLTLLVLSLVLCASAQNGFGRGQFSSPFAGSDRFAPAGQAQQFSSPFVGSDRFSPAGQAQQFSSAFVGSERLALAGQAQQIAKQIEDRVKGLSGARGFGGGGTFSSTLARLRGLRRGTRAQAEQALRERISGAGSGTGNNGGTLLDRVDGDKPPTVLWTHASWTEAFDSVRSDLWWFAGPWANGGVFGNGTHTLVEQMSFSAHR